MESPPTILVRIPSGTAAVDEDTLIVFPGSILHLECLYSRKEGNPQWTWTSGFRQYLTGKFLTPIGIFFRRQFFPIAIVNRQSLSRDPSRHTMEPPDLETCKGASSVSKSTFLKATALTGQICLVDQKAGHTRTGLLEQIHLSGKSVSVYDFMWSALETRYILNDALNSDILLALIDGWNLCVRNFMTYLL